MASCCLEYLGLVKISVPLTRQIDLLRPFTFATSGTGLDHTMNSTNETLIDGYASNKGVPMDNLTGCCR